MYVMGYSALLFCRRPAVRLELIMMEGYELCMNYIITVLKTVDIDNKNKDNHDLDIIEMIVMGG